MTKNLGLSLFLALTLILGLTTGVLAGTDWHITWNEDGTVGEQVLTDDQELAATLTSWGFSQGTEAGSYYRNTENWSTFNNLEGKFPIIVDTKNLLIFYSTTFTPDRNNSLTDLMGQDFNLQITVPGFYFKNSGQRVSDLTTQWQVYPGWEESLKKPYLTKCITFNGFMLGLFIVLVGLCSIGIVFIRSISRVNNLIAEEYSIEDYLAELDETKKSEE